MHNTTITHDVRCIDDLRKVAADGCKLPKTGMVGAHYRRPTFGPSGNLSNNKKKCLMIFHGSN